MVIPIFDHFSSLNLTYGKYDEDPGNGLNKQFHYELVVSGEVFDSLVSDKGIDEFHWNVKLKHEAHIDNERGGEFHK